MLRVPCHNKNNQSFFRTALALEKNHLNYKGHVLITSQHISAAQNCNTL